MPRRCPTRSLNLTRRLLSHAADTPRSLAVSLLAVVTVALACGPAAPREQAGGAVEATPTPTPDITATATATAETTPTGDSEATATAEPTSTATTEATPVPTTTPFLMSDITRTMLKLTDQAAASQDSDGATGAYEGPTLPDKIGITINFLKDRSQSVKTTEKGGPGVTTPARR